MDDYRTIPFTHTRHRPGTKQLLHNVLASARKVNKDWMTISRSKQAYAHTYKKYFPYRVKFFCPGILFTAIADGKLV